MFTVTTYRVSMTQRQALRHSAQHLRTFAATTTHGADNCVHINLGLQHATAVKGAFLTWSRSCFRFRTKLLLRP